jgi:hypothetical protein
MDICNVRKPSVIPVTFDALKELTLKTNLMGVTNVAKVFTCSTTLKRRKGTYSREKSYGYEQFPVTLANVNSLCTETV